MGDEIVGIFAELGRRLARFGTDGRTREVVRRAAVEQNPWFQPREIELAARNIAAGMLAADDLRKWLSAYPALPVRQPGNVLIVMAGNIPFAGFQDLLCVLAAGHRAVVKPSSKDEVLMRYIADELLGIAPGLPVSMSSGGETPLAVIAMGGDSAVAALRQRYAGTPVLLRGHRSSLAVLDGTESPADLAALSDDILAYSGLGCRSVSLVFIPRGYDTGALKNALSANAGKVNPKYMNNYRQTKALLAMSGTGSIDCGVCTLVEAREFPAAVSRVNYVFYDRLSEVTDWISEHDAEVQCIAGNIPHPRAVGFGKTQRPTLTDYPDGCDTMEFLAGI